MSATLRSLRRATREVESALASPARALPHAKSSRRRFRATRTLRDSPWCPCYPPGRPVGRAAAPPRRSARRIAARRRPTCASMWRAPTTSPPFRSPAATAQSRRATEPVYRTVNRVGSRRIVATASSQASSAIAAANVDAQTATPQRGADQLHAGGSGSVPRRARCIVGQRPTREALAAQSERAVEAPAGARTVGPAATAPAIRRISKCSTRSASSRKRRRCRSSPRATCACRWSTSRRPSAADWRIQDRGRNAVVALLHLDVRPP